MLAENEYAWQIIEKNTTKRINIYRDWEYKTLHSSSTSAGTHPDIIYTSGCIYTVPNETSVITIQTLTTDDDGHSSRLVPNDTIAFGIQYTTTTSNGSYIKTITRDKLNNYNRYKIIDGQTVKYVYVINFSYYLSNISNYKNIRVFSIYMNQAGGVIKGNETSLIVNYTQDIL